MNYTILVGFKLPKYVEKWIINIRRTIESKYGASKYEFHQPHITLYLNSFNELEIIKKELIKIANLTPPFNIELEGIDSFNSDPILNETILILRVKKGTKNMKIIQKKIIKLIHHMRSEHYTEWFLSHNKINPKYKENLIKTGLPISLDDYIFHTTICSIPKKFLNAVKKDVDSVKFTFKINELSIFQIKDNRFIYLESFKLEGS